MALTPSTMLPIGTDAPAFALSDTDCRTVTLDDFQNGPRQLLVCATATTALT